MSKQTKEKDKLHHHSKIFLFHLSCKCQYIQKKESKYSNWPILVVIYVKKYCYFLGFQYYKTVKT